MGGDPMQNDKRISASSSRVNAPALVAASSGEPAHMRFAEFNEGLQAMAKCDREHQQVEQRWRGAFESSAIGIMMADFTGRIFAANKAYRMMLGYTESELYKLTFLDITRQDDRAANLRFLIELRDGKRQHYEMEKRYRRKDGSLIWVRTNVTLVRGMGNIAPFGLTSSKTSQVANVWSANLGRRSLNCARPKRAYTRFSRTALTSFS